MIKWNFGDIKFTDGKLQLQFSLELDIHKLQLSVMSVMNKNTFVSCAKWGIFIFKFLRNRLEEILEKIRNK